MHGVSDCVCDGICLAIPQPTEWRTSEMTVRGRQLGRDSVPFVGSRACITTGKRCRSQLGIESSPYFNADASLIRPSRICVGVHAAKPKTNAGLSFASMQKND